MSLRFADSFNRYKLGNTFDPDVINGLLAYWTNLTQSACSIVSTGRTGQALSLGAGVNFFRTLTHETGWTVTWAYSAGLGVPDFGTGMYEGRNNATGIITVAINSDGTLQVTAGSQSVSLTPTAGAVHANKYYDYELQFDMTVSMGGHLIITSGATLRVNTESLTINGSDWDTGILVSSLITGDATINAHSWGATHGALLDDVCIADHNNGVNDGAIGDVSIRGLVPNGDSTPLQFSASVGTSHFLLINQVPPIGDASSIFDSTVNHRDIWDWQNLTSFTGTITGVVISIYARKDAEGARSFCIQCVSGSTTVNSPTFFLGDDYIYYFWTLDQDPDTSAAWTASGFNAAKFGVKIIS